MAKIPATRRESRRAVRRSSIVGTARGLFLELGYAETSMSAIAAALGGSKATLWTYFSSKEDLFGAVLMDEGGRFDPKLLSPRDDIQTILHQFGRLWLRHILAPPALRLQRIIDAEAIRFPAAARLHFDLGPGKAEQILAARIERALADGDLRPCDPRLAARQFLHLCQANHYLPCLSNVMATPTQRAQVADVEDAVDTFMRAFGRDRPSASAGRRSTARAQLNQSVRPAI